MWRKFLTESALHFTKHSVLIVIRNRARFCINVFVPLFTFSILRRVSTRQNQLTIWCLHVHPDSIWPSSTYLCLPQMFNQSWPWQYLYMLIYDYSNVCRTIDDWNVNRLGSRNAHLHSQLQSNPFEFMMFHKEYQAVWSYPLRIVITCELK